MNHIKKIVDIMKIHMQSMYGIMWDHLLAFTDKTKKENLLLTCTTWKRYYSVYLWVAKNVNKLMLEYLETFTAIKTAKVSFSDIRKCFDVVLQVYTKII